MSSHDRTKGDIDAGLAGPCKKCGTFISVAPDFTCNDCSKEDTND